MEVRPERPEEAALIRAVHVSSFPTESEGQLVDLLRVAGRLPVSLVAEVDGRIVGHIAFSPVTCASAAGGAGLGPLAVLGEFRRQGIAAKLAVRGLAACREAGTGWAVVIGDPAYYSRFGFRPASDFGLIDEFDAGAAFQALELSPGLLPRGAGLVRYAPEFDPWKRAGDA